MGYQSGLVLALNLKIYNLGPFLFAAPLETRGIPFIPMISPSPSQEELQTILGKFHFNICSRRACLLGISLRVAIIHYVHSLFLNNRLFKNSFHSTLLH